MLPIPYNDVPCIVLARSILEPLAEKMHCVDFTKDESNIVPGVTAVTAPGHTPGHMAVCFESKGERLYYIGDTVLSPLHLEFRNWKPVYDIVPDKAEQSISSVFGAAADEKALVIGQHFPPFPSLGRVDRQGDSFKWTPV